MLTNIQIESFCTQTMIQLVDVTMKNELPPHPMQGNYIINLQSSTEGDGTHWTALLVRENMNYFFDSFGAPPSQEIVVFCAKTQNRILFNNSIIQNLHSDLCGYYCIGLLHAVGNGKDDVRDLVNDYINKFRDNTSENAGILKSYFREWSPKNVIFNKLMLCR